MLSSSSKMSGTVTSGASSPLDLYEPLEVIGNGSFGIVRKVRRKSDGEVLARKELNFVKMSESDRDKIMVEVNILKDLRHENIVRYTDRFADNDAGILYILMEYCEGGDLSSMINQSGRSGHPLPEDTIWSYLLQLLLALHHCHFPGSRTWGDGSLDGNPRQILHRDLKPENVFIGKGGILKLGDFGLSKALCQASFTNTFVGTPFYMSPELFQGESYDTKTDIWSLGCLIYELCARRPLFHETRTYDELKALIHKCSIPPLPEGYSQALSDVIKSMLNLNHETRPSTQQLLQHQQIDFARKMADKEKTLKAHESYISELQTRNAHLELQVAMYSSRDREKDSEINRLKNILARARTYLSVHSSHDFFPPAKNDSIHSLLKSIDVFKPYVEHTDNQSTSEAGLQGAKGLEKLIENIRIDQHIALEPGSSNTENYEPTMPLPSAQLMPAQVLVPAPKHSSYGSPMSIIGFSPKSLANGSPMSIG